VRAANCAATDRAGLREVDACELVVFWQADPASSRSPARAEMPVASAPRLYADLSSFGAHGQDAANHVKSELIDPLRRRPPGASRRLVYISYEQLREAGLEIISGSPLSEAK
jgi:hypothetical protein